MGRLNFQNDPLPYLSLETYGGEAARSPKTAQISGQTPDSPGFQIGRNTPKPSAFFLDNSFRDTEKIGKSGKLLPRIDADERESENRIVADSGTRI
jgi:hypothetical protein